MGPTQDQRTEKIAELNDLARSAMGVTCRLIQTRGICALSEMDQSAIRGTVERFDNFTADNDPYGERDFGAFTNNGHKIFGKIDYYAPDLRCGSTKPECPKSTVRVLTIMLAEEY